MIDRLNNLASFMNVTASETSLAMHLFDFFQKKGLSAEIDQKGSVIVRLEGVGKEKRKIMICTPMDVPGFICLYREDFVSYLAKTCKNTSSDFKCEKLLNEKGEEFPVKESKFDKKELCIDFPNGKIGDVFRKPCYFKSDDEFIYGNFVCRYILIDLLMNLIKEKPQNDVLLCFTTGFYSFGVSEANIAYREKPDTVLMLGYSEDDGNQMLFYVKNGKNFAPMHLFHKAGKIADKHKIKMKTKVSETEATKEASVISAFFTDVFSFGLPHQKDDESKEKVSIRAINDLEKMLMSFF